MGVGKPTAAQQRVLTYLIEHGDAMLEMNPPDGRLLFVGSCLDAPHVSKATFTALSLGGHLRLVRGGPGYGLFIAA